MSLPPPEEQPSRNYRIPQDDRALNEIHGSVVREKAEPHAAARPLPVWLVVFFCLIIFTAGLYLGTHSGDFRSDVFDADLVSYGPSDGGIKKIDPIATGRRLYSINCSSCHQPSGLGVPGQYPPLAGSEIVQSQQGWGPNHIAMIVINGLAGPITVKGVTYNGVMPTHKEMLKDEQIAFILTYIRQEWGNKAGPISKEGVASIRTEFASRPQTWTEAELKAVPAKELPGEEAAKEDGATPSQSVPDKNSASANPAKPGAEGPPTSVSPQPNSVPAPSPPKS